MRAAFVISIASVLFGASAPAAPIPADQKLSTTVYYPTTGAVVWTYDTPTGEVKLVIHEFKDMDDARVGAMEIVMKNQGGSMVFDIVAVSRRGVVSIDYPDKPCPLLRAPVRVGDTWDYARGDLRSCSKVVRTERLKVPAGTFETVCVETSSTESGEPPTLVTIWYAPNTGMVKKTDANGTWELKKFWQEK